MHVELDGSIKAERRAAALRVSTVATIRQDSFREGLERISAQEVSRKKIRSVVVAVFDDLSTA